MDENTSVREMQHSVGEHRVVRYLERIDVKDTVKFPPERLERIWDRVKGLAYASDDAGASTPSVFISNLFNPGTEHYVLAEDGYANVLNIIPGINADIHMAVWGDVSIATLTDCFVQIAGHLFTNGGLHRITAYIPAFNKQMIRFATILGFKYEGEIRQIFKKKGVFHNLHVYGMLREEFERRYVKEDMCLQLHC